MAGTPEEIAADWAQKLGASTAKIQRGINSVTVAPGQAAARQKAVYVQNVNASQDKWAANTASVTLQSWQNDFITKGLPRIATGATAAQGKFATFMGQLLPYVQRGKTQIPARGNLQQNIARSAAWITYMAAFKRTG